MDGEPQALRPKDEPWAFFWFDLLEPVLTRQVSPGEVNRFLKNLARRKRLFPSGALRRPSLSTLRRKLRRYRKDGFLALARRPRADRAVPRAAAPEIVASLLDLKREQPRRSHVALNRFLESLHRKTLARSTLYRWLKWHGATRLKLGVVRKKVRCRWTMEHTHDLWLADFEHGPFVLVGDDVRPSRLCAVIVGFLAAVDFLVPLLPLLPDHP